MSRYIKTALFYTILGLLAGLFYREFTKFHGVAGGTSLGVLHTHTLVLGLFFFLILALFEDKLKMSESKHFNLFYYTYNIGLLVTLTILTVRGITEVLGTTVSSGLDGALSGIAGLGHISLSVGLITILLVILKGVSPEKVE